MIWDETDELEDYEYPDEPGDDDDFDDDNYVSCPDCGADIYEDVEQCPACGIYITTSALTTTPTHWKLVAIVVLIAFGLGALWLI